MLHPCIFFSTVKRKITAVCIYMYIYILEKDYKKHTGSSLAQWHNNNLFVFKYNNNDVNSGLWRRDMESHARQPSEKCLFVGESVINVS